MKSLLNTIFYSFIHWGVCCPAFASFILCSIVLSCADDQDGFLTSSVQAVFTTSVGGSEAAFSSNETNAGTRASNDTWDSGDQVGIYMVTAGGSIATSSHIKANNVLYQTIADGTDVPLAPVSDPIYYPIDGSKVNFVAYYPHQSSFTTAHTYAVNVASQTNPADIDLLYHKGTTSYSQYNAAATLNFEHKLSKIILNITRGAAVTSDLTALTSTITGTPTKANFTLATGNLSGQGTTAAIATRKNTTSTTSTKSVQEAIIVPHNGSGTAPVFANRTITFTVSGTTYTYPIPTSMNFEAGKVYNYDFTLTPTGIILSGSTIVNWTGGDVVTSGNYTLSVAPSSFSLTSEAKSNNSLIIRTNYTSAPGIQFSSSSTSVINSSDLIQNSFSRIGTGTTPYTWELKFGVTSTSSVRSRYIHITVGTQTYVVPVNQTSLAIMDVAIRQPSSNCYIVPPGGAPIAIPVSRANEFAAGAIGSTTAFTAELVWSDLNAGNDTGIGGDGCITRIETNGTGSSGHIIVHPGRHEGNAVVAVKVNNEIKWSWHIWVTTYNPLAGEMLLSVNGKRLMERPLGALNTAGSAGVDVSSFRGALVYQWGRKDPFTLEGMTWTGTGEQIFTTEHLTPYEFATIVKSPGIFSSSYGYLVPDLHAGWAATNAQLHEPCPHGWTVTKTSGTVTSQHGVVHYDGVWHGWGRMIGTGWYRRVSGELDYLGTTNTPTLAYWFVYTSYIGFKQYCFIHNGNTGMDIMYPDAGLAVRCQQE